VRHLKKLLGVSPKTVSQKKRFGETPPEIGPNPVKKSPEKPLVSFGKTPLNPASKVFQEPLANLFQKSPPNFSKVKGLLQTFRLQ